MRKVSELIAFIFLIGFIGLIMAIAVFLLTFDMAIVVFVAIVTIGSIVLKGIHIFNLLSSNIMKKTVWTFYSLCGAIVIGFVIYSGYMESLQVVSTQDVNLQHYEPFSNESELVTLDEEPTFQIDESPPRLDGATALYPVYAAFAEAVYPEDNYNPYESEVRSSQTDGAFRHFARGEADVIFTAEPSTTQKRMIEDMDQDYQMTPIGKESFVFFTHADNPVETLTVEEIQGIYSGEITNWSEVGGDDQEIKAFQRPEGSGSQSAMVRFMAGHSLMDPPSDEVVSGMGGVIEETEEYHNHRYAIGYTFRYFATEMVDRGKIDFIGIDGVYPDQQSIRDGSYPVSDVFYAIYSEDEHEKVEPFVEWILSEQGQRIIDETGYASVEE
ncbi:substrate-binding domain-containing protein [Alkalibacillus haloalkaliphilus]|uniref:PBP domain-containing protein n=1 Tax=Alkalibacillus haloalkaliphilus TaxID=94136 RepID=A0A511W3A4_9BACI|nr:substrate-binding domain-containing protein [Alkalibacillus haloalkaliphilus]GEN45564.1 hypothetical protein AHA02nite_13400 [Alkalibacillus haloalkaliphilus]